MKKDKKQKLDMPWVIRAYISLLILCAGGIAFALFLLENGYHSANDPIYDVLNLAIDSFKIVLGAILGALSMLANKSTKSAK